MTSEGLGQNRRGLQGRGLAATVSPTARPERSTAPTTPTAAAAPEAAAATESAGAWAAAGGQGTLTPPIPTTPTTPTTVPKEPRWTLAANPRGCANHCRSQVQSRHSGAVHRPPSPGPLFDRADWLDWRWKGNRSGQHDREWSGAGRDAPGHKGKWGPLSSHASWAMGPDLWLTPSTACASSRAQRGEGQECFLRLQRASGYAATLFDSPPVLVFPLQDFPSSFSLFKTSRSVNQ